MLLGLIEVTWFDTITIFVTFMIIVFVKATDFKQTGGSSDATTYTNTARIIPTNGHLQKQKSEQNSFDEQQVPSSPVTKSPLSSARNSFNSSFNGSFDDEFHEDEDTLSLENLFPCDQTEIYASKKISFIIDELLQTEVNYVNNLKKGLQNYGKLQDNETLPETLQSSEKQKQLLGNIDEILELHEQHILPMMLRNQHDLKQLFDDFAAYFDKDNFYCYVIFTMNKKTSIQLRQDHKEWFQAYQGEIKDKLGIDSFLVQPIQRLTRYPLLLQQFISEFYKSGISCKPVLTSVCKLETRTRRLLDVVNQAEEIPTIEDIIELDVSQQGRFRKSTEFDAYHFRTRKKFRAKLFLFERCLLCAEVRKKRVVYKQAYPWDVLEIQLNSSKNVTIFQKQGKGPKEEYELSAPEAISVSQWIRCCKSIIEKSRQEAALYGKFSVPTDLVLGIFFGLWFLWSFLWFPN